MAILYSVGQQLLRDAFVFLPVYHRSFCLRKAMSEHSYMLKTEKQAFRCALPER